MKQTACNCRRGARLAGALILSLAGAGPLWATNGFVPHGAGTKNKAMAGAGIALPEEAMAAANNPATALLVSGRVDAGIGLFMPKSNYFSSESDRNGRFGSFTIGPNQLDAADQNNLAPYFAACWRLGERSAFALALDVRSGIDTEYRGGTATFDPDGKGAEPVQTFPGTLGDGDVQWKSSQVLLDIAYARQFGERVSLGLSGVLAAQSFKVGGIGTLAPLTKTFAASGGAELPERLSGNGRDRSYGAGLKLGLHTQWSPRLAFGLAYQTRIRMGKLGDYADLLPHRGALDLPADLKAGLSWRVIEPLVVSADVQHIFYSDVDALGNSLDDLLRCPTAGRGGTDPESCLGGGNGGGLGWEDMTVVKLGLAWTPVERWTLRAGFSLGHQPIPISDMNNNLFTPYLADAHYTFGFTRKFRGGRELNFSFMYTEEESLNERNRFDIGQFLISEASQLELEIGFGWAF